MQPLDIITWRQLQRAGWSRTRLERELREGALVRIRQGYYCRPGAAEDLVRAVRVGGSATGPTALRHLGVWAPTDPRIHVAVTPNAGRLRDLDENVVVHWSTAVACLPADPGRFRPVAPLLVALEHAAHDVPPSFVVAMVDSAMRERRVVEAEIERLLAVLPRELRRAISGRFDARAESGIESIARYLLERAGIRCELQVRIDGVGRVDLLIDGWLIIELDGGTHATPAGMRQDRLRDAAAVRAGYRTLRFSYDDVLHRWPALLQTVRVALAEGAPLGIRVS